MDFKTLCTGCRTYRRFTQEKIAPEVLDELMDNVRIANSAMNGQVLRYVLVKDPDLVAKMQPMIHWRSEERRVGKECRSRWSPYH